MEKLVAPINEHLILGALQQIQKVNYMIDFCILHNDDSMVRQFERQREGFLEELNFLLANVGIHANLNVLASA
jgi:hypothetical protein